MFSQFAKEITQRTDSRTTVDTTRKEYDRARFLFRGSGHTLRTEAGDSRFIEEAPPRAFSRERISTLRRSAYREEEAGVSRKVKAQCIRQHIKLCQPREILTPRMSRESLCDMGGKDADRATIWAPIVISTVTVTSIKHGKIHDAVASKIHPIIVGPTATTQYPML